MEIFPAIDIKDGKVVRLTQGDYDRMDIYSTDPYAVATDFFKKGAKNLHIVDLDGAKDGTTQNFDTIKKITDLDMFIQVGGGIRTSERAERYLDIGVNRVILGTAAITNENFLKEMISKHPTAIAVGVDAKDGYVAVKGWREITSVVAVDFCKKLAHHGVQTIIYTDISKDGAMKGPAIDTYKTLVRDIPVNIIASGGVSCIEDIKELAKCAVAGVIIGKAIYTGAILIQEALQIC